VQRGRRVLAVADRVDRVSTTDGVAFAHEAGRAYSTLRGDQIERAAFVVRTPATPVGAAIEQRLKIVVDSYR
jgi:hypothetical protein